MKKTLFLGGFNRTQNQIYILFRSHPVGYNTVVEQISDDRQIQYALLCVYVRNICNPLLIWPFGTKVSVKQIRITM